MVLPVSESEMHVIICKYYYCHILNTFIFSIKINILVRFKIEDVI
jgi:hypothetical protein